MFSTCLENDGHLAWVTDELAFNYIKRLECVFAATDAGKPCIDGSECQSFMCIIDHNKSKESAPVGVCSKDRLNAGISI